MQRYPISILLAACALGFAGTAAAAAQPKGEEQEQARQEMQAGNTLSIRQIERRYVPAFTRRNYEYLGFEYDPRALAYRLKFIRAGRVEFVDVSARTGKRMR